MEHVIVERTFAAPIGLADLQGAENDAAWCLRMHNVRFLHSYFSSDRKRMICVYEAPDAEAVRKVQRTANLPFDNIWTASVVDPETLKAAQDSKTG